MMIAAPLAAAAAIVWPCTCPGHKTGVAHAAAHHGGSAHAAPTHAFDGRPAIAILSAAPASDVPATAALIKAANAKLSPRCRRLIKTKRPSKLSARDRARRSRCFAQRRAIIRQLAAAETPAPTTPATDCGTPCVGAVGVRAIDNGVAFELTRTSITADIVAFELENADRQLHNLAIAPTDSLGNVNGPVTMVIADTPPVSPTIPTPRPSAQIALAPGTYKLICTLPGHGPMAVDFTVRAPTRAA